MFFRIRLNPNAQFPMEITIDTVLNAVKVADPLGLFDCSPVTDGAAAVWAGSCRVGATVFIGRGACRGGRRHAGGKKEEF